MTIEELKKGYASLSDEDKQKFEKLLGEESTEPENTEESEAVTAEDETQVETEENNAVVTKSEESEMLTIPSGESGKAEMNVVLAEIKALKEQVAKLTQESQEVPQTDATKIAELEQIFNN